MPAGEMNGTNATMSDNMTLDEYLLLALGPKRLPDYLVIPITVVYILLFITGVIGNVAVCIVIVKNKSMQTATNFYLFSLAVSDLAMLILGEVDNIVSQPISFCFFAEN